MPKKTSASSFPQPSDGSRAGLEKAWRTNRRRWISKGSMSPFVIAGATSSFEKDHPPKQREFLQVSSPLALGLGQRT